MSEPDPAMPLGTWLAGLPDEQLIRLLELRPDLTQPPPGSIAALAARAQSRQSVKAATDDLDFLRLSVLDGLLFLHADASAVPTAKLVALFGGDDRVLTALDDLRERGLVWGETSVRVTAEAASGLPWHPGQVTSEATVPDPRRSPNCWPASTPRSANSWSGWSRDRRWAGPGTPGRRRTVRCSDCSRPAAPPGRRRHGDPAAAGGGHARSAQGPTGVDPPDPVVSTLAVADTDAAAAGSAIDVLREVELVLDTLSSGPVAELRSGGLGFAR
ncbi:hypothetical protein MSEDJ_00060 [Mycolicibacterium sediminis]|uniref:DNA-binding protein n=1 Tax=Mycolicibacterium sediminis TaxID=1286180 RepID=A0A7I7QIF3_9MYCO|nr:hypothetical protein MSEDJ_00060 [Mycolicibacterium sediminis]